MTKVYQNYFKGFKHTAIVAGVLMAGFSSASCAKAEESAEDKIARSLTAAPASITDNATIADVDGTVLRAGTNGWTCVPGIPLIPGDKHPMCNDAVWMKWIHSMMNGLPFETDVLGTSYMLAGDALVDNNNPAATDPNDGGMWIQEGPHLMMILPHASSIANLPRTPFASGPYVMWDNTPLVHIMVPLGGEVDGEVK